MNALDFMTNRLYEKPPGVKDKVKTHPKIVIIKPDGTILFSDMSNDGMTYQALRKEFICERHEDYMKILAKSYFKDNEIFVQHAKNGNVFGNILDIIQDGNILFNNITTYEGPTFYLHGLHAQLLVVPNPTEEQKEALKELNPYVNYFREIEVKEYIDIANNIKNTYFEPGEVAISNFLERNSINAKKRS